MNQTKILIAVLAFLASCAYKLPEAQVLRIFARHSFKEHAPEKLRTLIREKGLAGLKLEDKYAEMVRAERKVRMSLEKPVTSAGILVGAKGGAYFLLRVFKGSPAEAAGLKDGDKLLAVNSATPGSEEFLKTLSGKPEFKIKVVRRSGACAGAVSKASGQQTARGGVSEFEADVKEGEFYLPLIFGFYEPETRAAFVRMGLFFKDSSAIAAAGLTKLQKYGVKSVILDLRGNKGGSPREAAALLKLFAAKPGPVLAITSRHKGYTQVFKAAARGRFAGMRLAALVDPATSMTGEVFAASLKEIAGATVIGGKTAGNVSVQKTFSLAGGRGLRLTVARLAPPSENDLEETGLVPEIPVEAAGRAAWASAPADALLKDPAYLRALELLAKG